MAETIPAHGGVLVNRVAAPEIAENARGLFKLYLTEREQCDLEMIASGAFSPLVGFMNEDDFNCVCDRMRLASGTVWPIPITCNVDKNAAEQIEVGQQVGLYDQDSRLLGILAVESKYTHDKNKEATTVYQTESTEHPGVAVLMQQGSFCLSGPIEVIDRHHEHPFAKQYLTPPKTRAEFESRGWKSIVAFQTRNPIHRAHEYLTKCALEICDGLLVHPLVGLTQEGDIPADVRMQCYEVLLKKYYPSDRTLLSVMPAAMRYAGPREAILHAIIRQNYGCTHFIVGRDHAGVGNYYGTYDAQKIFDVFSPGELAITPLKFEHASWCRRCEGMVSNKTCPHPGEDKIFLSGTKVRELLARGEKPPMEFSRTEVADVLITAMHKS